MPDWQSMRFSPTMDAHESSWNQLKREPKQAKIPEIKRYLFHLEWLTNLADHYLGLEGISQPS